MASPKIFYARLSDYTLSASSTDASYPLANLQTYYKADVWKPSTLGSTQYLNIDFGSARSCNSVVIDGQNFGSVANLSGVDIQGANDSGFSSGVVTPTLSTSLLTNTMPTAATFAAVSRRYWRLRLTASGTMSPAPAIGNLFLGTSLDFEATQEFPFRQANGSFDTVSSKNLQGAVVSAQEYGGRYTFDLQFKLFSDTFKTAFGTFFNTVRGKLRPFYFQADDGAVYFVNLSSDVNPLQTVRYNLNDFSLQMQGQLAELT